MPRPEQLISNTVRDCYEPLMTALQQEYPERYPMVCGPASMLLPRMQQMRDTGVPLRHTDTTERFEIEIGIFDPTEPTERRQPGDHSYLRYYSGDGQVTYIDCVYQPLWGGTPTTARTPIIETYREDEIDQALKERYALFPFDEQLAQARNVHLWHYYDHPPVDPMGEYADMRSVMHSDRIFGNQLVTDAGEQIDVSRNWGTRLQRVAATVGAIAT